jgi:hypothetical protein
MPGEILTPLLSSTLAISTGLETLTKQAFYHQWIAFFQRRLFHPMLKNPGTGSQL